MPLKKKGNKIIVLDLKKKIEKAFGNEVYQNNQIQKKVLIF